MAIPNGLTKQTRSWLRQVFAKSIELGIDMFMLE